MRGCLRHNSECSFQAVRPTKSRRSETDTWPLIVPGDAMWSRRHRDLSNYPEMTEVGRSLRQLDLNSLRHLAPQCDLAPHQLAIGSRGSPRGFRPELCKRLLDARLCQSPVNAEIECRDDLIRRAGLYGETHPVLGHK